MNDYIILHYGFIPPTPEQMGEWNSWFQSIADRKVDQGHFPAGKEFSEAGAEDLPFARESITGFTMIKAENLEEAAEIASKCPFVDSTRVYEVKRNMG